jgi:hypothetical protein
MNWIPVLTLTKTVHSSNKPCKALTSAISIIRPPHPDTGDGGIFIISTAGVKQL